MLSFLAKTMANIFYIHILIGFGFYFALKKTIIWVIHILKYIWLFWTTYKMTTIVKKKKIHTKSKNRKIVVERGKINIPDTQTNDRPRSLLGTIKSGKVNLVLWGQSPPPPLKIEILKLAS